MEKALKLYIGDKHLSSWSMRPWLLMKNFEIPFEETRIRLDQNGTKEAISKISPSGQLPVLRDHDVTVWDSLAICEYLAEKYPRLNLWPDSTKLRFWARSLCSEMHSSFRAFRKECPMNLLQVIHGAKTLTAAAQAEVDRIDSIFHDTRELCREKGAYLLGEFGILDAYFMPVISRIRSYGLILRKRGSAEYYNHVINSSLFKLWVDEARAEAE